MYVLSDDYDAYYRYYGLSIKPKLASYKFIFLLNRYIKTQFRRDSDIILEENNVLYSFSSFFYKENTDEVICSLIENKSCDYTPINQDTTLRVDTYKENTFLLSSYKHVSFILRIDEELTYAILNTLNLQQADFILSVEELNQLEANELERIRI